jgi:hypothetical protein
MPCAMPVGLCLTVCYEIMKKIVIKSLYQFVECLGNMAVAGMETNTVCCKKKLCEMLTKCSRMPSCREEWREAFVALISCEPFAKCTCLWHLWRKVCVAHSMSSRRARTCHEYVPRGTTLC